MQQVTHFIATHVALALFGVALLGLVALLLHPSVALLDQPTAALPLLLIGAGLCKCCKPAPTKPAATH